jgi:hypothetical protein
MLDHTPKPTVQERDAAHYIGMTTSFLRTARRKGYGPAYIRFNRTIRYRIADLDAWLDAHRVQTENGRAV